MNKNNAVTTSLRSLKWKHTPFLLLSMLLGLFSFFIPVVVMKGPDVFIVGKYSYSVVGQSVELMVPVPTVIMLFLSGILLGKLGRSVWFPLGLMTMALFPLVAMIEMNLDSTSHNLFPIEFGLYGFFTLPAVVGAYPSFRFFSVKGV